MVGSESLQFSISRLPFFHDKFNTSTYSTCIPTDYSLRQTLEAFSHYFPYLFLKIIKIPWGKAISISSNSNIDRTKFHGTIFPFRKVIFQSALLTGYATVALFRVRFWGREAIGEVVDAKMVMSTWVLLRDCGCKIRWTDRILLSFISTHTAFKQGTV